LAQLCKLFLKGGIHEQGRHGSRALRRLPATPWSRGHAWPGMKPDTSRGQLITTINYDDVVGVVNNQQLAEAAHREKTQPFAKYSTLKPRTTKSTGRSSSGYCWMWPISNATAYAEFLRNSFSPGSLGPQRLINRRTRQCSRPPTRSRPRLTPGTSAKRALPGPPVRRPACLPP
jgi:hypothetical protein